MLQKEIELPEQNRPLCINGYDSRMASPSAARQPFTICIVVMIAFAVGCMANSNHPIQPKERVGATTTVSETNHVANTMAPPVSATTIAITTTTVENSLFPEIKCGTPLYDHVGSTGFQWSSDGRQLLLDQYRLYLFDVETLILRDFLPPEIRATSGVFSPDGQQIAVIVDHAQDGSAIYLYDLMANQLTLLISEPNQALTFRSLTWAPDGQSLAYILGDPGRTGRIWVLDIISKEKTIIPVVERQIPGGVYGLTWSPDGLWIAFIAMVGDTIAVEQAEHLLFLAASNGEELRRFSVVNCVHDMIAWSPDGQQLAFSGKHNDIWVLYVANAVTGGIKQLTFGQNNAIQPYWSPDGERVIFLSIDTQFTLRIDFMELYQQDIYEVGADGANLRLVHSMDDGECCLSQPVWVPGQDSIAFFVETIAGCTLRGSPECQLHIDVINSDGTNRRRLVTLPQD